MSSQPCDVYSKQEVGNGRAGCAWAEQLTPLLQEMLAGVRRHRETALLAGFDSVGIATGALHSASILVPQAALSHLRDMQSVKNAFSLVLKQAFRELPEHIGERGYRQHTVQTNSANATTGEPSNEQVAQWLAVWLEQFCAIMNDVHPKAVEVVMLRAEGCDDRQAARRLGLPLRLVKRIVCDIQQACDRAEKG